MIHRGFQPAFTTGEVSPPLAARIDLQKYDSAAKLLLNVAVRPEGGATKTPGLRFTAKVDAPGKAWLLPFSFNLEQSYILEFTPGRIRVVTAGGVVTDDDGNEVIIETPYAESEISAISYAQSADVLYLAHVNHTPKKLMRRGHADWALEDVSFTPKTLSPGNASVGWATGSVSGPTRVWRYRVTAIDFATGEESLPTPVVSVTGSESMRVGILQDGAPIADWYAIVLWTTVAGANEYRVYKETSEGSGMYGYIGSAVNGRFADRNIEPNAEDTPPVDYNPFEDGNYPSCVAIHQQRLVFANSNNYPNRQWSSRTGNFENFTKSLRTKDDDYIEMTLASNQVNPITFVVGQRTMITGTTGAAWEISGGGGNGAITPGSIRASMQSARGSAKDLQPALIDNTILYVSRIGDAVLDLQYDFNRDAYAGTNRALFASHLFAGRKVVQVAYQESPYSIVWFVMDDGLLLGLTWNEGHDIFAWHRHKTDGVYESAAVIPGTDQDDVFFVVRREVMGETVRYIERMESRFVVPENYEDLSNEEQQAVLAKAFFVHSGLSYEGEAKETFTGLEHLEGKELAVLADGGVHPPVTVKDGSITLDYEASIVHAGLPYTAKVETVNFELPQQMGTSLGRKRRIPRVAIRLHETSLVSVGINGQAVEPKWRTDEPFGMPPRLRSGIATYVVPGTWGPESSVTIEDSNPTPMTVLTIVPEVSIEG